jgi:hypothetical protein
MRTRAKCVPSSATRSCDRRLGTDLHEAELGEELDLIEEQMLGGELVAASLVSGHPAEVDEPTGGRDLASGRAKHAAVRPNEPPFSAATEPPPNTRESSRRPSGNASQNAPRNASTSSRPRNDAPGATNSASSVHGSASAWRALNASTCRSTTCFASAMSPYLLCELRKADTRSGRILRLVASPVSLGMARSCFPREVHRRRDPTQRRGHRLDLRRTDAARAIVGNHLRRLPSR